MSRILILGGTRFVGRLVAEQLAQNHEVTVLSRNDAEIAGARRIIADRAQGLRRLRRERFDSILDFIAFDDEGVREACELGGTYLAISSAWLPRLNGARADEPVPPKDDAAPASMLPLTRRYLLGKARLEACIRALRAVGYHAASIRLPILMGTGDHTKRLEFYRLRIADGEPLIAVNGGENVAQILWSVDAARAVVMLSSGEMAHTREVWEALPDEGWRVADFLALIADSMGCTLNLANVPQAVLAHEMAGYLDSEPLWRETPLSRTGSNVFAALGWTATAPAQWLGQLPPVNAGTIAGRAEEIALARRFR